MQTQQIILQLSRLALTQQLLTSGKIPPAKEKTQPMDSGTLLAKAQDCLTILILNSEISNTMVQLNFKLVTNSSLRTELYSVLNH